MSAGNPDQKVYVYAVFLPWIQDPDSTPTPNDGIGRTWPDFDRILPLGPARVQPVPSPKHMISRDFDRILTRTLTGVFNRIPFG